MADRMGKQPFRELEALDSSAQRHGGDIGAELALVRQSSALRSELTARELEIRRLKAELEAAKGLFSEFYDNSPVGYLTVDRNGMVVEANIRCAELLGLERKGIPGKNLLLFVSDEFREASRLFLRKVFESEGFQRCKLRFLRAGAGGFQALLDGMPVKAAAGKASQCRMAITDVTERDRVERLLHLQRDLSRELCGVLDLKTAADCLLGACMRTGDVDCGLFYAMEANADALRLVASLGFESDELARTAKSFLRGSQIFIKVAEGSPEYFSGGALFASRGLEFLSDAGVKSVGVLPVHFEGSPVACLLLASRRADETPSVARAALESLASETGSVLMRIKMDAALRESEQRLRGIMDNANSHIYIKDLEGRYLLTNKQFAKKFKLPTESIDGISSSDLFPPAVAAEIQAHDQQAIDAGKPLTFEENIPVNGERRTYLVTKFPLFDKDGAPCGVCGIDMDITDRKRTEEELRASEERFRTVADFAYAWEYWVSPKGELRYVSPSVERITGRSRQEFMENPKIILDLIHPEDREQCGKEFFASLDADDVHKSEFRIVLADGSIRWIGHVCQAVYSKTGEYLGRRASNDDITEKKIAAEALAKAVEAAENANRVKSMFIANLSHEIRTPMNAIIGFTDLVLSTHLTEDQRKCLGMVKARGEDLLVIIGDILDISRIEAGKTQLAEDRINLKELVRDLARSFHHEAMKKSLSMAAKVSDEIPPDLIGDPVRIRQVLVNLLGNALKFTQRGSILLSLVCVEPPSPDGFCTLLFTVSDTGIGIPKEKQAAIFDAFTQADSSTVRKFGGTGLGLAICSKLVAMMSGRIWVESETGKGSNFLFTIRLRVPAKATPGEAGAKAPGKS